MYELKVIFGMNDTRGFCDKLWAGSGKGHLWFFYNWYCLGILPRVVRDGCRALVLTPHLFANPGISWLHGLPVENGFGQELENSVLSSCMPFFSG